MTDDAPNEAPPRRDPFARFGDPRMTAAALAVAVLSLVVAAWPMVSGGSGDFGTRVRSYLLANPDVLDEVVRARDVKANADRVNQLTEAAQANPALLAPGPNEPAFGPADARVTVVEYFDYRCPYCKLAAPGYVALMREHPDVRFVFREWPILDREGEITSQYAARAALVAHSQGKYIQVHQALMAERSLTIEAIDRILAAEGVNIGPNREALQAAPVAQVLADVQIGAAQMGLDATPTFFVNGKAMASNAPEEISRAIRAAR
jgi:protein-disulfide isomerase